MSSWFAKVFDKKKQDDSTAAAVAEEAPVQAAEAAPEAAAPPVYKERKVINAPIIHNEPPAPEGDGIRIKAQLDPSGEKIVLMVDRPLLQGYSCWCGNRAEAQERSPLALAIFDSGGIESVLIHEMNATVTRDGTGYDSGEDVARRLGKVVRAHLESGAPAVSAGWMENMPPEDSIRDGIQRVIDEEINPGIAAHSGNITLTQVKGNTVYIKMGGGCQGCAASSITLRQGVEGAFRAKVPQMGALLDDTDHSAGANPFFTSLPMGMGG
jgi:Fe-S cluster biogenesis protein NfuA